MNFSFCQGSLSENLNSTLKDKLKTLLLFLNTIKMPKLIKGKHMP